MASQPPANAMPLLYNDIRPLTSVEQANWKTRSSQDAPFLAKTQHLVIAERADEAKRLGEAAHAAWNGHIHHLTRKLGRPDVHNTEAYSPDSAHPLMTGTPAQVAEQLAALIRQTGINYLLCVFSFGDLAPQHAMRSLELFASEVRPALTR